MGSLGGPWGSLRRLGISRGSLEDSRGRPGGSLPEGPFGSFVGALGASWVILGATLGFLGFPLGVHGSILGRFRDAKSVGKLKSVDLEIDEIPVFYCIIET